MCTCVYPNWYKPVSLNWHEPVSSNWYEPNSSNWYEPVSCNDVSFQQCAEMQLYQLKWGRSVGGGGGGFHKRDNREEGSTDVVVLAIHCVAQNPDISSSDGLVLGFSSEHFDLLPARSYPSSQGWEDCSLPFLTSLAVATNRMSRPLAPGPLTFVT